MLETRTAFFLMDQTSSTDDAWLDQVKAGDFSAIPDPFTWDRALLLSQAIGNMYRHARAVGLTKPRDLYEERLEQAKRTGQWRGTTVELWVALWYAYHLVMMAVDLPAPEDEPYLDQLCTQLRDQLQAVPPHEKATLMTLIRIAWTTERYPLPVPFSYQG
ncbi:hypothetical protein [Microvirga aerophila]|uniref:Uncharacterized protein n=1 Tax=Microvirga aerophila TaxID=670291 RepID=A0A512BZM6_9HYPH|nr:hypothetical protein [Microvirga aerophila]GEO17398.1 hypothetical protein MAE02_50940 [Microvirga aerophila]